MNVVWNVFKIVWCAGAVIQTADWLREKHAKRQQAKQAPMPMSIEDQLDIAIHTSEIDERVANCSLLQEQAE